MTVNELVELAMKEIEVLADGESPTTTETNLGIKRFNTLVSSLRNDLVFLTYQDTQELITVAGVKDYQTAANTHKVLWFDDTKVNVLSRKDYDQWTDNDNDGRIDLFVEYNTNPPTIKFCVAPTESGNVYTYRRNTIPNDLVTGDEINLNNDALEMLILGLAFKLTGSYGVQQGRKLEVKSDYLEELNRYRQSQTFRTGGEIVTPQITIV